MALLALALIGLAAGVALQGSGVSGAEVLGAEFIQSLALGVAALALTVGVAVMILYRGRVLPGLGTAALGMTLATLAGVLLLVPRLEPLKSQRPLAEILMEHKAPDAPYAFYGRQDAGFLFYTEQYPLLLEEPDELERYLRGSDPAWLLVEKAFLGALDETPGLVEVARDPDEKRGYVLFRSP